MGDGVFLPLRVLMVLTRTLTLWFGLDWRCPSSATELSWKLPFNFYVGAIRPASSLAEVLFCRRRMTGGFRSARKEFLAPCSRSSALAAAGGLVLTVRVVDVGLLAPPELALLSSMVPLAGKTGSWSAFHWGLRSAGTAVRIDPGVFTLQSLCCGLVFFSALATAAWLVACSCSDLLIKAPGSCRGGGGFQAAHLSTARVAERGTPPLGGCSGCWA